MQTYYCQLGQSFTDVTLDTYGDLNSYVKLLNDNDISPNEVPYSGQPILWGESSTNTTAVADLALNIVPYSAGASAQAASPGDRLIVEFLAVAGQFDYTVADVPDLGKIVGKTIYFAMMDDTRLLGKNRSWDGVTFSILWIESIVGGEEIIIFAK